MSIQLPTLGEPLGDDHVSALAQLALDGIPRQYPNKPNNVMARAEHVQSPREMHPAFFGCFDWHSSVHAHWMLVRILRLYPACSAADSIRALLASSLTLSNLQREADHFALEHNAAFERMYGWAWLLRLVTELEQWNDNQGNEWRAHLGPLEKILIERTIDYLPKLDWPIRTGQHPDTGFALAQMLDYAQQVGHAKLEALITSRSRDFYLNDVDYPLHYEPSGHDFFSSGLNEADLMRRVLAPAEFGGWFDRFLPTWSSESLGNFAAPLAVSDVRDGKLVHLAGLNLSRAWCLQGIQTSLGESDPRRAALHQLASAHAKQGYEYVFSGGYEGEHWLATFVVYLHTRVSA